MVIHTLCIWIIPWQIRFDVLVKLIGGELKDIENKISNKTFNQLIAQFASYNATLVVIFVFLGRAGRKLVIENGLNETNELLRLNNKWWYLFNGVESNIERFDFVYINTIVDTKEGTVIYSGYLVNYICVGEELERIYLKEVTRRQMNKDGTGNFVVTEPIDIQGDVFCVNFKNVINMNLSFFIASEEQTGE